MYPRANCAPPIASSPFTPTGASLPSASITYNLVFSTGRPIATGPASGSTSSTSHTAHPTPASVGPYSLKILTSPRRFLHHASVSPYNASPPTTTVPALIPGASSPLNLDSKSRWAGVIFNRSHDPSSRSPAARRSTASPSITSTAPPLTSGVQRLVTVRSKPSLLCSGDRLPPSTPYRCALHSR